jgi:hypothetical protein
MYAKQVTVLRTAIYHRKNKQFTTLMKAKLMPQKAVKRLKKKNTNKQLGFPQNH